MAFPGIGDPYSMWSNGFPLELQVTFVHADGRVEGTISDDIYGTNPVPFSNGTWDDYLRKLSFTRTIIDTGEVQTYTGFFFDQYTNFAGSPINPDGNQQPYYSVIAGTFTSVGGYEDPVRAAAGWGWFAVGG